MEDPQSPEELARIHEQLWQTVLQFGNFSASQERNRIARDLHDSLGQALTALNIQLQTAVKLWQLDPERAEQFLAEAQRLGSTAVQEVRQTVRTLRTDCPDDQSIDTLIASLVDSFHRSTGVLPTVKMNLVAPLPPEVVTPIYRIIQEGLNNICKYAQATAVTVQVSTTPTSLGLIIEDNGRGFDLEQAVTGFGLRGMQERVSLLRGRFQVETQPGAGCRIRVVMPLRVLSLQDPQGLVPPPPTPETIAAATPALSSPAPSVEGNGAVEVANLRSDDPDLTRLSDGMSKHPPAPPLPQMGEPAAIASSDLDLTTLSPGDEAAIASSDLDLTTLSPGHEEVIASSDLDLTTLSPGHEPDAVAALDPDLTTLPGLVLAPEQRDRLTQILLEWVGPIAPILLQRAIAQVQQPADFIEQLAVHVPPQRRSQFEQQVQGILSQAAASRSVLDLTTHRSPVLEVLPTSAPQPSQGHAAALSEELTHYCEQELTALIGPIAHFLMQEALTTDPEMSLEELIDRLATNIPHPQTATQFKQRILSYAS